MTKFVITVADADAETFLKKVKTLKVVKSVKKGKLNTFTEIDWTLPSKRKATPEEVETMINSALRSKNISAEQVRNKLDAATKKARSKAKAA